MSPVVGVAWLTEQCCVQALTCGGPARASYLCGIPSERATPLLGDGTQSHPFTAWVEGPSALTEVAHYSRERRGTVPGLRLLVTSQMCSASGAPLWTVD